MRESIQWHGDIHGQQAVHLPPLALRKNHSNSGVQRSLAEPRAEPIDADPQQIHHSLSRKLRLCCGLGAAESVLAGLRFRPV